MKLGDGFEPMQINTHTKPSYGSSFVQRNCIDRRVRISPPQLLALICGSILLGVFVRSQGHSNAGVTLGQDQHDPSQLLNGRRKAEQPTNTHNIPRIAWLMSFPNSGTSFTSKMIRHISRVSTSTNYGHEATRDVYGRSIQIHSSPNRTGPFWVDPQLNPDFMRPTKWVLTKTHCGSRCETCGPSGWAETPRSFLVECLSGKDLLVSSRDGKKFVWKRTVYEKSRVGKAVHLIRNPFNNIVSRFHLEQHAYQKRNDTASVEKFPLNRDGFRAFCGYLDHRYEHEEKKSRFIDAEIWNIVKDVPCRSDFLRYIQWHDLAFVITRDMKIAIYVLHYEDYENKFDETMRSLVRFLEYPSHGDTVTFVKGKDYAFDYFTEEERGKVEMAIKMTALSETRENLARYF